MNDNAPDYRVVRVQNSSSYDTQRGAHRTKEVHFRHADGTLDYVTMPLDQYTPENVQTLIEQATAIHKEVVNLRPGQTPSSVPPQHNLFG